MISSHNYAEGYSRNKWSVVASPLRTSYRCGGIMLRNSRLLTRHRTSRLLRWSVPLIVLITGAAGLGAVPLAQAATAPTATTFSISSTSGWQRVPHFSLTAHQAYTVSYVSGSWTVDRRNFPWVGPGGYSNSVDQTIYQGCKYNPGSNYAVLLGAVGDSATAFPIGQGGIFNASSAGPLYLRINDDDACLGDNAGSVKMHVSPVVQTPFNTYAGYTAVAGGNGAFGLVAATWVVPQLSFTQCWGHVTRAPRAAAWVGLWGTSDSIRNNTAWLPQIGTVSSCNVGPKGPNLGRNYFAFWEMFTGVNGGGAKSYGAGVQPITSMTVKSGDKMTGVVEYEKGKSGSNLVFKLQLFDVTRTKPGAPDQFSITVTTTKPVKFSNIMNQGGAVMEPDCRFGLAKFTSVPFTDVQAVPWNGTPQPTGMSLNRWTMTGSDKKKTTLAEPGALFGFPGLMNYTVTYRAGGPTTC
jgi:hypothetical protein